MMLMMGHAGAVAAIMGLVVSTAFLMWVAGKPENPLHKLGKGIGWIAFVLMAVITICSLVCQAKMCMKGGCGGMKGCPTMGGGDEMSMPAGMERHKMMMERMRMPPPMPDEEKK